MQTLENFLKDKTLPCKVTHEAYLETYFVEIHFKDMFNHFHGLSQTNEYFSYGKDYKRDWQVWQEPKKKVAYYMWAYKEHDGHISYLKYLYKSEDHILSCTDPYEIKNLYKIKGTEVWVEE